MSVQSIECNELHVVEERDRQLLQVIERSCDLLPIPGPITAFAFLNTLQALEELPFDTGMRAGARLYGAQPYLTEQAYRNELSRNRIDIQDLSAVLKEDLGPFGETEICALASRFDLRLSMLRHGMQSGPPAELRWFIAETDALRRIRNDVSPELRTSMMRATQHWVMRDLRETALSLDSTSADAPDARLGLMVEVMERFNASSIDRWNESTWEAVTLHLLWRVCCDGVAKCGLPREAVREFARPRDGLLEATRKDCDLLVHPLLARYCAAFTDQGFAAWPLPEKSRGFFTAFLQLYGNSSALPDRWLQTLPEELRRVETANLTPLESIRESLELLGVAEEECKDFLTATLLALRGWAGIIWHMETRGDRVPQPVPSGTLVEFLAVRLILDRIALGHLAKEALGYVGPLVDFRTVPQGSIAKNVRPTREQRAFIVFQLAQVMGWAPPLLHQLSIKDWNDLIAEIEAFGHLERRKLLHSAFERHSRVQLLDAISVTARRPVSRVVEPRFQAVFCLDAREESFRRHLEETAPDTETFGAAGFYGIAMYYRGLADAHFAALCPVVIRPNTWVTEDPIYPFKDLSARRAKARRMFGTASRHVHIGSRDLASGAVLTSGVGILASIPLVARVLFPRWTARIRRTAEKLVSPPPITRLRLERTAPTAGANPDQIGYSLEEMANIGERQLRDMGLTENFARLFFIFGHGSFCLNNPHKSTYDCGACSGTPGGPNGRALAIMLNDERVRGILSARGLIIPLTTRFIGAMHNTGYDSITYYDLDQLPKSHLKDFEAAKQTLAEVCQRNAHERCRRFESAPLDLSIRAAHRHVEGRCEDLAQTRPEYGNATNSSCFVGRRERVRGLFMDRRCFLTSYDPIHDDAQATILARILAAAVPVCEGINMQYYLSRIDSKGWACGTKLPHNVASLLGVMDGAAGDLRPGLPWQSVEIHEPVRLQFVIETTPEVMILIMENNPVIRRIFRHGWSHLALLDPHSAEIRLYRDGQFELYQPTKPELPNVETSLDWYRGWRDHLGFATIGT